ncbi:ABC transporter ATP-binding protein [Paractinoplanes abujensis]|uniref:Peptide/nickel transport system ATP-binding protein n=1 Tax=Paractinoplanes abujensis TaxID=882441 RepID=A0A7W7CQP9_9ACTN|nr:ABC transporter ATP-binding protein [Actinoplanes abujensis]MBB4692984.1 peptide/nickel transport system ATP-binding protein [Actinoplanes abujensis]GID22512.1 ABC transporter ATP-binding protein [Actinoplanes abujensis]
MTLVRIRGLDVGYARHRAVLPAVTGLDLTVAQGEVVAIVGESGSGKTTTANALIGLLPANGRITAGSAVVNGVETAGAKERVLRGLRGSVVGLIPQDPMVGLNPTQRVGAQVAEAVRLRGVPGPRAHTEALAFLEEAGVPDPALRARQYPHELSGGLRQRVLIAIALAGRPKLIIADEPTSALDVTVQKRILDHLEGLVRDQGISLLIITHDLAVAADRADRIVVMRDGRKVEEGEPGQILHFPAQPYTRRLVEAATPAFPRPAPVPPAAARPEAARLAEPVSPDVPGSETVSRPAAAPAAASEAFPQVVAHLPGLSEVASGAATVLPRPPKGDAGDHNANGTVIHGCPQGNGETIPTPVLALHEVSKIFSVSDPRRGRRGFNALEHVSFEVPRGRTHALVGESGCGKTTTLRIALGLETATSGSVRLDGTEIAGLSWSRMRPLRRKAQLVHQDPFATLDPKFSVRESIVEPLVSFRVGNRRSREARARELLDQVALPVSYLDRKPRELSGGQRQRVAIARALALQPELIMLDEPVSALDVLVQEQILRLLAELQRELGLSYLFVSHDLAVVARIAHTVSVMSGGRIVEQGRVADVFTDPGSPRTRELVDAVPGRRADAA